MSTVKALKAPFPAFGGKSAIADDAWLRTAVHSENGTQTLLEIFDHAVDHLESHLVAIVEKRRALGL